MNLFILRHGIAVEPSKWSKLDFDRPLTGKGIRQIKAIGKYLKKNNFQFDLILSSSYLRALHTAKIVAKELKLKKKIKITDTLIPSAKLPDLIKLIKAKHSKSKNILLVGHEPFLSRLIAMMITGNENAGVILKKGGFCKLTVETFDFSKCGLLNLLLEPSQMI